MIYLQPGVIFQLGGEPLRCNTPVNMNLASSYMGATLDAEKGSRVFEVTNGCRLTLRLLNLLNGKSTEVYAWQVLALQNSKRGIRGHVRVTYCPVRGVALRWMRSGAVLPQSYTKFTPSLG